MSVSETKIRIHVECNSDKLLVPLPLGISILKATEIITERAKKRSGLEDIQIIELRLKQENALLDEFDEVGDVLRDGDVIVAVTAKPEEPAPASASNDFKPPEVAAPQESGEISINIKPANMEALITIKVASLDEKISSVSGKVKILLGFAMINRRLFFNSVLLDNESTLRSCGIANGATLDFAVPPPTSDAEDDESEDGENAGNEYNTRGEEEFKVLPNMLFPESEESATFKYRTPESSDLKEISLNLNTTMDRFREILVEQGKMDVASVIADIHLFAHPILVSKETAPLTLAQWGLNMLGQFHAHLRAGSQDEDGEPAEIDTTLYVSFRSFNQEAEKYTTARKDLGEERYWLKPAWQPFGFKQTDAGMSSFLSTLYVVSSWLSKNPTEINRFLGHFSRRVNFPPATNALEYLIKQKSICPAQKSALATGIFHFMRKLVPADVAPTDDRVFEQTPSAFGFLLAYIETADVGRAREIFEISLTCSLTRTRLQDPVTVSSSETSKVYNRKSLLDRMQGGPMFITGSPWSTINPEELKVDDISRFLLLAHPYSEEVLLTLPVRSRKMKSESESLSYPWQTLLQTVSTDSLSVCCNIAPSLSLQSAKVPSLAMDASGLICVYLGPEPCSVDTVTFLSPSECKSKAVTPAMIAKALGQSRAGVKLDSRPVKEAIIVCFDTSSSMSGYSFSSDKNAEKESAAPTLVLKASELHAELQKLREDKFLPYYRRLSRKRPAASWRAAVLQELSDSSALRKALIQQERDSVLEILNQGEAAPDEEADEPQPGDVPDRFVRPADSASAFQIFVKSDVAGKTLALEVDGQHTIQDLKVMINERLGTPGRRMKFIYASRHINDDTKTISFYGVEPNGNLFQAPDFSSARFEPEEYTVQDMYGQEHIVSIRSDKTVSELKLRLWEKTGTRPSQFSLWCNLRDSGDGWRTGTLLDENQKLFHYRADFFEMDKPYKRDDTRLTRMETVKQLFHAFINRSQAYNYANHIGLMLFGSDVEYACSLTPLFEVFRDEIDNSSPEGETALYDALDEACDNLVEYQEEHPGCRLRVIVLSDGGDTCSEAKPWDVAKKLQTNGITCDSVLIGDGSDNKTLRAISKSSGGYCFAPKTLRDALKLNELETFLSLHERPEPKGRAAVRTETQLLKFTDLFLYPFDVCNDEVIPQRRMPDAIKSKVQALEMSHAEIEAAAATAPSAQPGAGAPAQDNSVAQNRMRRIMKEISSLMRNPHPAFDIYPNEDDLSFWKIVMTSPDGCPYTGGTWLLYMSFPENFPQEAPEVRFLTPIRHANVNSYGKICHSIFTRNWTSDISVSKILSCVYGLLLNPDCDDPIDTFLALQFFEGNGQYEALIMGHVKKHASAKTREGWRRDLLPQSK